MKKNKFFVKALIEAMLKEADVAVQDIKKGEEITPDKVQAKGGEVKGDFNQRLKAIFKQNYEGFVSALGKFAGDPKFRNFVKSNEAIKSSVSATSIPVKKLIPTQNEIDVDKSLKFPLTDKKSAQNVLKSGKVTVVGPIITFNGKYIIDGHHRWSQLYAANPDASISVLDFKNDEISNPIEALKLTQLAIVGAGAAKIPVESVQGNNLLKLGEEEVKKYVNEKMKDDVLPIYKQMKKLDSKEAVANYIAANVKSMQSTSQPVSGAPKRNVMPQTDKSPGGSKEVIKTLRTGLPAIKETDKTDLNEVRKLQQRAGLRRKY